YTGSNTFQSDRASETVALATLQNAAGAGSELTWTVVPEIAERRIGVDRDSDGFLDRDEIDVGADPADPQSFPGGAGVAFCFGDGNGTDCPCGNSSPTADHAGCLNSLGTGGKLVATGVANLSGDTITLLGSQMPNSSALYLQGTQRENFGCGTVLYDGLLCAGGTLLRLGSLTNSG